ncbi:DUF6431 domain-containing protein [Actinomadura rupiterrae]|uniref:DUF6431 domain-containing protein n=1 Tax=Actinomadura rupiterrae TaxID=559627 RepID=UPI0020A32A46|nr:DUF6431 domain-containing protein [Actinomadura rupiterrae]MCP2337531.1 transposase-like protein [Actinomadura rupiterrae]MCP2343156.1 transposase-like protein [Actinomadura rupiterrae]
MNVVPLEALVVTVEADAGCVERRLRDGELSCPDCSGVLVAWGHGRSRGVRGPDGRVEVRPRRARCSGCGRTHVLLPVGLLARRADTVEVIGAAVEAAAGGRGHRPIARLLGRPAETVRGWLRRFAARAERLRSAFTALLVALDGGTAGAGAVLVAVAVTARRRLGGASFVDTLSVWALACAVSRGGLLAPGWAPETINTN